MNRIRDRTRLHAVDGALLAGGASRRFGRDKTLHPIEGKPMIVHVYDALAPFVENVWISVSRERSDLPFEAAQVIDVFPGAGPLAGVHAVMCATRAGELLVLSADLPYVTGEVLERLLAPTAEPGVPVVARTPDGRLQPLCARYPTSLLRLVEENLTRGRRSMHALLDACTDVLEVEVPLRPLTNLNRRPDVPPR